MHKIHVPSISMPYLGITAYHIREESGEADELAKQGVTLVNVLDVVTFGCFGGSLYLCLSSPLEGLLVVFCCRFRI